MCVFAWLVMLVDVTIHAYIFAYISLTVKWHTSCKNKTKKKLNKFSLKAQIYVTLLYTINTCMKTLRCDDFRPVKKKQQNTVLVCVSVVCQMMKICETWTGW